MTSININKEKTWAEYLIYPAYIRPSHKMLPGIVSSTIGSLEHNEHSGAYVSRSGH